MPVYFQGVDDQTVQLTIRSYQFPAPGGDKYDDNWLMIGINKRYRAILCEHSLNPKMAR